MTGLDFPFSPLFMDLLSTARAAPSGAAGHFDVSGDPINVGIVFPQPSMAHNHVLFAQVGYCEEYSFCMVSIPQVQFHYVRNRSCFVRGTVHIADGNRVRECPGGEAVLFHILSVDEHPSSPGI